MPATGPALARRSWSSTRAHWPAAKRSSIASESLVGEMLDDAGVRLPGARRDALLRAAERDGIEVADGVLASLAG